MPRKTRTIKIFLASSSELRADRDQFDLYVRQLADDYQEEGITFQVVRWENFTDHMSRDGLQSEYEKAIEGCQIFVSLFHTKAGKYTEQEFTKAVEAFMANGIPLVYTYFKDEKVALSQLEKEDFLSLADFKQKLSELPKPHYPTPYDNIADLKLHFTTQLTKILPKLMPANKAAGKRLRSRRVLNRPTATDPMTEAKKRSSIGQDRQPMQNSDNGEGHTETDFEFADEVFALLIGIDQYKNGVDVPENGFVQLGDSQFTNLKFCSKDISRVKQFLLRHSVDADHITDLTKPANTDRATLLKELKQFSKKVNLQTEKSGHEPLVIVFISCHGITDEDDSYFVPHDADRSNLVGTAISHSILKSNIQSLKTSKVLVLLDACHSGGFAKAGGKGSLQHDQIADLADTETQYIIASCKPDQKSWEKEGHGIFTLELLKLLESSYHEISDENISTTNLLKPLARNVWKASDFKQEPIASPGPGIVLGKNVKRRKENERKAIEMRNRRQEFLTCIEDILTRENKDYPIAAELLFYINKGRFVEEGYENFLDTFDKYANDFWGNKGQSKQVLEDRCGVLINYYTTIKRSKQAEPNRRPGPVAVPASTAPTESKLAINIPDSQPVDTTTEFFGPKKEEREKIVLKKFNKGQIDRITEPINRIEYYDEVILIDRILRNSVTQQMFMAKMRERSRMAETLYPNDSNIIDGISKAIKLFIKEWPNAIDEIPKNSLTVRF